MPPFEVVGGVLQWKLAGMHISFPMNEIQEDFHAKRHVRLKRFKLLDISAASGLSCDKLDFVFVFSAC